MPGSRSSAERRGDRPLPGLPEKVLAEIEQHLRRREELRDSLADRARQLRRQAQFVMNQLHQGRHLAEATRDLRDGARELAREARDNGEPDQGTVAVALQECVEATLLVATFNGEELPGPTDLGIDPEPYLLGLGDLVGELRRRVLQELSGGDLPAAERLLVLMEELTLALARFEAPRSIVALKPKQDQARALLERTRGDVTLARLLDRAHLPARRSEEP